MLLRRTARRPNVFDDQHVLVVRQRESAPQLIIPLASRSTKSRAFHHRANASAPATLARLLAIMSPPIAGETTASILHPKIARPAPDELLGKARICKTSAH